MDKRTLHDSEPDRRPRRLFDILNRHRLKLAALVVAMALLILLADVILKGAAY